MNQGVYLQEVIDKRLSHTQRGLRCNKPSDFAERVLAAFDSQNQFEIENDLKQLSGGETVISDTNLPAGFQRTVIRDALSDLNVLKVVQTLVDPQAQGVTGIPYESRDISEVTNQGIVYEGNAIPRASVSQDMDLAYILPMKMAFVISNEVMHFSKASPINWDAYARNVESNARVIKELVATRICNELQRAADAYGAVSVSNEAFDTQLTGSNSLIKTAEFPIVRPHLQRDLKGTIIGSAENPITLTLNGTVINEYDGSGNQSAGIYYRVTSYNLGYIQLMDETGTPVTPADTGTNTISYDSATNVTKFDTDLGSDTKPKHWNGFLQAVGARKAIMAQDRYEVPDFMLMSYTLNNDATDAENFTAQGRRDASSTTLQGDLDFIKGLPAFSTNTPHCDLGEERCLIGQRDTLSYVIAKPWSVGSPSEMVDSSGRPIGKKQAYGEEYSAIKVPTPIRNRLTSILAYSFTGR